MTSSSETISVEVLNTARLSEQQERIESELDLMPSPIVVDVVPTEELQPLAQTTPQKQAEDDFALVRNKLQELMQIGSKAMQGALDLASSSDSPKAYETVAIIMSQISDAATKLLSAHLTKKKLESAGPTGAPTTSDSPQTINNTLFLGSSVELQKLLSGMNAKE